MGFVQDVNNHVIYIARYDNEKGIEWLTDGKERYPPMIIAVNIRVQIRLNYYTSYEDGIICKRLIYFPDFPYITD